MLFRLVSFKALVKLSGDGLCHSFFREREKREEFFLRLLDDKRANERCGL